MGQDQSTLQDGTCCGIRPKPNADPGGHSQKKFRGQVLKTLDGEIGKDYFAIQRETTHDYSKLSVSKPKTSTPISESSTLENATKTEHPGTASPAAVLVDSPSTEEPREEAAKELTKAEHQTPSGEHQTPPGEIINSESQKSITLPEFQVSPQTRTAEAPAQESPPVQASQPQVRTTTRSENRASIVSATRSRAGKATETEVFVPNATAELGASPPPISPADRKKLELVASPTKNRAGIKSIGGSPVDRQPEPVKRSTTPPKPSSPAENSRPESVQMPPTQRSTSPPKPSSPTENSRPESVQMPPAQRSITPPNPRSPVSTSLEALERAKNMINQLSAVSRSNSIQEQKIDLAKQDYPHPDFPQYGLYQRPLISHENFDNATLHRSQPVSQGSIQSSQGSMHNPMSPAVELNALGFTVSTSVPCAVVLSSRTTVRSGDIVLAINGFSAEAGLQNVLDILRQLEGSPSVTIEISGFGGVPRSVTLQCQGALSSFRYLSQAENDAIPPSTPPSSSPLRTQPSLSPKHPLSAPSSSGSRTQPRDLGNPEPSRTAPLSGNLSTSPVPRRASPPTSTGPTRASPPTSTGPTRASPPSLDVPFDHSAPPPPRSSSRPSSVRSTPKASPSMRPVDGVRMNLVTASPPFSPSGSFNPAPAPVSPSVFNVGLPPMPIFMPASDAMMGRGPWPSASAVPMNSFTTPPPPIMYGMM